MVIGENNIFKTTENAVEQNNKAQVKEKIELAIMEKQLEEKREVSLDEIIDKLIEKGITSESNSDREIGTVITEEGYVATIKEKEEGGWEVIIGEKGTARIKLNISKTPEILTSKVTIKIEGRLIGIGLKELQMPDGSKEEYEEGITKIEETYEVTANGTYKFVLIGRDEQEIEKEITINNIVEGIITILPSTTEWTKDNIIVEVIYPEGTEELIREISIDNGVTWKEYKEGVEISENTTIKARLKNTEEIIKTATLIINKIDKTAPTAPTITGGSTEYSTSRTISVSVEPIETESGIAYYEYYLTSSSTEPTEVTTATEKVGTTANEKSKTFNTNYAGYYVYIRAIDNAKNVGKWSLAQRLYIDINKPTVTAKQSSVTIDEGESKEISSYFTYAANGNATITSVIYTDTSNGNKELTNTNTLSSGTHTIICTVTKENGLANSASISIFVNTKYEKVSYTNPGTYTWTVPDGITRLKVTVAGAGGGGSGSARKAGDKQVHGGAGGNGELVQQYVDVSPGQTYTIVVGAGGEGSLCAPPGGNPTGADQDSTPGGDGEASSAFGINAAGGGGGTKAHSVAYGTYNGSTGKTAGNGQGGKGGDYGREYAYSPAGIWDGKNGGNGWVYIEYGTTI